MTRRRRLMIPTTLITVALAACSSAGATKAGTAPPARVERVKGSAVRRVILSARAVDRLGLKTIEIAPAPGPAILTAVPYAAVIYDPQGRTWVYAVVGSRTYERARIKIERIDGDQAWLAQGPSVGTAVVSVGAAEVYGTEFFSAHE